MDYHSFDFVNEQYCRVLSKLSVSQFKQLIHNNINDSKTEDIDTDRQQYEQLIKYCNKQLNNKCKLATVYKFVKNKTDGRMFVTDNLGLQRMRGIFRGVLSDGVYWDFDMVNCHPQILLFICKKNNISCRELNYYCTNRDFYFNELIDKEGLTKDEAKKLYLTSMNSDRLTTIQNKKKIKSQAFYEFDKEMKEIQRKLTELNPQLKATLEKTKSKNINGSLLNTLLCIEENNILQDLINKSKNGKINFSLDVLIFDGFLSKIQNNVSKDDIINTLNKATEDKGIK